MRVAWGAWVQGLLGLAKAALFVTIAVILMLVLADVAEKTRIQVAFFVSELLRKHYPHKKRIEIATSLSGGRFGARPTPSLR